MNKQANKQYEQTNEHQMKSCSMLHKFGDVLLATGDAEAALKVREGGRRGRVAVWWW